MGSKLYVGGLLYAATESQLTTLFAAHGTVESARVITDKFTGQSRGFGFVEMATQEEAKAAITALNGSQMDGRPLTVNEAKPQEPRTGGGGGGRFGGMFEEGLAAEPVPSPDITLEPERILAKGPFTVKREAITPGDTPSLVVRMRYTDRGTLTQKQLDDNVKALLKKSGFKTSIASSFKPQDVTWRWGTIGKEAAGDVVLYVPEVSSPPAYEGIRYAGSLFPNPLYDPSANVLATMPNQIWVYTVAVTSGRSTMTDGDAAQALTLLKQAMVNMAPAGGYASVLITLRGCPPGLFEAPAKAALVQAGWSALILLVAYNMVAPHIGSEVL